MNVVGTEVGVTFPVADFAAHADSEVRRVRRRVHAEMLAAVRRRALRIALRQRVAFSAEEPVTVAQYALVVSLRLRVAERRGGLRMRESNNMHGGASQIVRRIRTKIECNNGNHLESQRTGGCTGVHVAGELKVSSLQQCVSVQPPLGHAVNIVSELSVFPVAQ